VPADPSVSAVPGLPSTPLPTATGASSPLHSVDHVAVAVRDTDAALEYYTSVLGLTVIGDEIAEEPGVRLTYLDGGTVMIQLVQPVRPGPVASYLDHHGEGLHHLCFAVDDLDTALAALDGEHRGPTFLGGRGRQCAFLNTYPVGVRIELTERVARV
jgi:methylmalonyl-CoA/ethylmalonyl-CoA epimerase